MGGLPAVRRDGWATSPSGRDFDDLGRALGPLGPLTLVAATDGNHGRAVAHMARLLGYPARIFVPAGTAAARIDGIESEGAPVTVVDGSYDDAVRASAALATDDVFVVSDTSWEGYTEVPATVIDGYETIFAEVDEQLPDAPEVVVVPMGVGALAAATACDYADRATVVVVEPLSAACGLESAEAGRPVEVPPPHDSIMAGLNCGMVSIVAWPTVAAGADVFVAVDDGAAENAMRDLAAIGIVAGETGAAVARRPARRRRRGRARSSAAGARSSSAPRARPIPSRTAASSAASLEPRRIGRRVRRRRTSGRHAAAEALDVDAERDAPRGEALGRGLQRSLERREERRPEVDDGRAPGRVPAAVDRERQHRRVRR